MPFLDHGRDINGCDCWGLVRLIYREQLKIELPSYGEISAHDLVRVSDEIKSGSEASEVWVIPMHPGKYDVVIMRRYGMRDIGHVGMLVNDRNLIHVEAKTDAVIVPIDHMRVKHRIAGYRRHRSMV